MPLGVCGGLHSISKAKALMLITIISWGESKGPVGKLKK